MVLKVVNVKNPVLRQVAKHVSKVDKKILDLIKEMKATLLKQKDPEGVGLAAPQIGKSLQIFVVNYKNLKRVIINPEVIEISKTKKVNTESKTKDILEGCL